ncbi:MAG TPA: hypothetical protein DCZ03_10180 [Gammaproteobacteria bacterium]|nr:hypothetical protein [Gammaproteobacteria bacterium]
MWLQHKIELRPRTRGFHLVTQEIEEKLPDLKKFRVGLVHLLLQHTSASLSLNENADPDVRADLLQFFNRLAPENLEYFRHTLEGSDDMPAHIKTVLLGNELTVPIRDGRFYLGVWQGIYLGEHRESAGSRMLMTTIQGEQYA